MNSAEPQQNLSDGTRRVPATFRMIRKEIRADAGCSVVELRGVRRIFATVAPSRGVTLAEQAESALQTTETLFAEYGGLGSMVMQSVFLRNIADRAACRQLFEAFYGPAMPATSFIAQPPCDGKLLAIEVWGLDGDGDKLHIERPGDGLVTARHDGAAWAYLGDVCSGGAKGTEVVVAARDAREDILSRQPPPSPSVCKPPQSTYAQSLSAFRLAGERLRSAGWRFDEVIRTWLYMGDIAGPEGETCRYRELNRARADFYQDLKFGAGLVPCDWNRPVFPASTGIGALGDDLMIGCIALRADPSDTLLLPLENPLQTSAYDYVHQYGAAKPKFVRAMAVVTGQLMTTFISGTASITASESRHDDSAVRQTQQTLDNIAALIAPDNLQSHGVPGLDATLDDLALARVYVKRQADYEAVRAVCQARWGQLPTTYVVGDICRGELLVEIEGIAVTQR
jgi:enamine deaminase RidA (YjgF/YER057c/UK114 family)